MAHFGNGRGGAAPEIDPLRRPDRGLIRQSRSANPPSGANRRAWPGAFPWLARECLPYGAITIDRRAGWKACRQDGIVRDKLIRVTYRAAVDDYRARHPAGMP